MVQTSNMILMYRLFDDLGLVHGFELVRVFRPRFGYCIGTTCLDFGTQIKASSGLILTSNYSDLYQSIPFTFCSHIRAGLDSDLDLDIVLQTLSWN